MSSNNPWIHPANRGAMSIIEYQSAEAMYESLQHSRRYPMGPPPSVDPPTELERKESRFSGLCGVIRMWRRAEAMYPDNAIRDKWRDKYLEELDLIGQQMVQMAPDKHTAESVIEWRRKAGAA
jgi:hypothetical protein